MSLCRHGLCVAGPTLDMAVPLTSVRSELAYGGSVLPRSVLPKPVGTNELGAGR